MSGRKVLLLLAAIAVVCALPVLASGKKETSASVSAAGSSSSMSASAVAASFKVPAGVDLASAFGATSGKSFPGVTLTVVGVSGDQGQWLRTVAAPWAKKTGAKIKLNLLPFGQLQVKVLTALSAGIHIGDVLNVPSYMDGDLMGGGYAEPVPQAVQARLDLTDVMPLYRKQTEWGGKMYGYPWDGDVLVMYYRKDLLDNPANKAKFQQEFGYPLQVPKTWQQYHDVAKFFTSDWGTGKQHYGDTELEMRHNQGFHGFITRATAYSKLPNVPGFFFDPNTMNARINNPGFVQALTDLVDIQKYSPPAMPNWGFVENAQGFVGGLTAMDIQWADIGTMSLDPKISVVKGKVGFALAPGRKKVWDDATNSWVEKPNINFAPYAGFGGWQNVVPTNARNMTAAIDLASYYASPAIMLWSSLTGGTGVNPARYSTTKNIKAWEGIGFSSADATSYLDTLSKAENDANAVFQLRLPGYLQYQDALELAISEAISGQMSPKAALDQAAAKWNQITDKLGRDKQMRLYRQSIGLKP